MATRKSATSSSTPAKKASAKELAEEVAEVKGDNSSTDSTDEVAEGATKTRVSRASVVKIGNQRLHKAAKPHPTLTPQKEIYIDPNGVLEQIAWGVQNNYDQLLLGDTGTGKTSAVRYLAYMANAAYIRIGCDGDTDVSSLIGKPQVDKDGTYFQIGLVYEALREGYWLVLDEYNVIHPDVRMAIQSIFNTDEGRLIVKENEGEVVTRHPNFRLFATANPLGYAGTKDWNEAIMSRFDLVHRVEYLPEQDEADLLGAWVGSGGSGVLAQGIPEKMVKGANDVRAARANGEHAFPMSFRELRNWGEASLKFGIGGAVRMTVLNKVDEDDQQGVRDLLYGQFTAQEWGSES
jgi:hypothetical protein